MREFYLMDDNSILYDVDKSLIIKSHDLLAKEGFDHLRGADLVFACIAFIEDAYLVTLDNHYDNVSRHIKIIDLNDSLASPAYRRLFET